MPHLQVSRIAVGDEPHQGSLDYTPVLSSVPLARHRTARLVSEWGYPHLTQDVALVVSDPRGECRPSPRTATGEEQFGRVVSLVEALSDDWGAGPRMGVGKTVWAQ
ncbi:MAG: hypothetical protein LBV60_12485 [Streptomyces sp.]|nr:hypothetical protein [Streptomyces sp.]